MAPDEAALRAHLESAEFKMGEADGRWRRIAELKWPFVYIGVSAIDGVEYPFRFDCSGFPQGATGRLWDIANDVQLPDDLWPNSKSKSKDTGRVAAVFRTDWQKGSALYLPCDRVSIAGHDGWVTQMPSKLWRPHRGLVHYLELIHELLHCSDYSPRVRTAS